MKWQSKIAAASIFAMTVATGTLAAAPASWTGQISDAMCKGVHQGDAKTCVDKCIKDGSKYVLVVKDKDAKDAGKVYAISNQTFAGLGKFAGQTAVVTGEMKDDTITVTKIAAPKPEKK